MNVCLGIVSSKCVYSFSTFVLNPLLSFLLNDHLIQDCDMPEELKLPGTHKDAGIDHVNVKEFLHLKRAAPVSKASSKSVDPMP